MSSEIKIGNKKIHYKDIFFIIEEGQANQGNFEYAKKMIKAAAYTGADAIEFQLAKADDFYIKKHPGYEVYKKREFFIDQIKDLIEFTIEQDIEFIATPLSHNLIIPLTELGCSAFNVNASDIDNPQIIDLVCQSKKPFFVSLPMATDKEIDRVVKYILSKNNKNFILMLGQHTMASGDHGVNIEDTNLGYINTLKNKYSVLPGFIDHTPFDFMPPIAVAAGSCVITKHLAIDRNEKGPDWFICLEPEEMKRSINWARKTKISINNTQKKQAPGENIDRAQMKRSIVAAKDLEEGHILTREDMAFKRPGTGIEPIDFEILIGKKLIKNISKDDIFSLSDFK